MKTKDSPNSSGIYSSGIYLQNSGKEDINQRGNKETKDNPEGAAKFYSGDWSICP
jgi:hypothetical protein